MTAVEEPFDTIEQTQEFLSMLSRKIDEVLADARKELKSCSTRKQAERVQMWQCVLYTTTKLSSHVATSRKLMKDLNAMKTNLDVS